MFGFIIGFIVACIIGWFIAFIRNVNKTNHLEELDHYRGEECENLWRNIRENREEVMRYIDTRCDMIERNIDEPDKEKCCKIK